MKNMMLAGVLLLLTTRGTQADVFDFKAYSWANFGSPFAFLPTTKSDLASAINGGYVPLGGEPTLGTLDDLFQIGQTSWSNEYDVGGGLHVSFSAEAVYRPAEPLSIESPGIGAKAKAENNKYTGTSTVIGENFVYLKHTVSVNNPTNRDEFLKSYGVTTSLDGVIQGSGDAYVAVGQATRLTLQDGTTITDSKLRSYFPEDFSLPFSTYSFGRPVPFSGPPLTLTTSGPYGIDLTTTRTHSMTIETLLYVRAQTGAFSQGAGTAAADFSNTLRVSNIQFFDENDQVIQGLQVVGSDGAVYPYNVVPELPTLPLFSVGFFGMLLARFRRSPRS